MKKNLFYILTVFLATTFSAQTDSLAGFDKNLARNAAISENFHGQELRTRLQQQERKFINDKFGITKHNTQSTAFRPLPTPACTNEDFENSQVATITSSNQVSGWTVTRGVNSYSGGCVLTTTGNPSESAVLTSLSNGYVDTWIGSNYAIYSVFGGTTNNSAAAAATNTHLNIPMQGDNFFRLNSDLNGDYSIEKISKSFTVTSSSSLLSYAFITVMAPSHNCCDAGTVFFKFTNLTTNSVLSTNSFSTTGISNQCVATSTLNYLACGTNTVANPTIPYMYNPWQILYVDLSPYIGQVIEIEVMTADCTAGAHFAYCYLDMQCGSIDILVNGLNKTYSCKDTAVISTSMPVNSYVWSGPGGFSSTSSTFTSIAAGVYTLSIPQLAPMPTITRTINLGFSTPNLLISASETLVCKGDPININASGLSTYTWSSGQSTLNFTVTPSTQTTYSISGFDNNNCEASGYITVDVFDCSGINKITNVANLDIFPNPNQGIFQINLTAQLIDSQLLIFNELGQKVYSQKLNTGINKVDAALAEGVYYYSVIGKDKATERQKFTVVK